ncbi:Protein FAR-RED ELONGATED HYPOCOTYL 3, partial [Golovinomyces cichoracearum]
KRPNAGSRKTNFPFRIVAQEQRDDGLWRCYISEEYHNHEVSDALATSLLARATLVSTIRSQLRTNWQLEVTARDLYNLGQHIRIQQLGGKTPIHWLADELEQRDFFFRIDTDDNNRVTRLFMAHPECIKLLKRYPDVLLIDCTYKTNRFSMPLVNICGSSGNNMTPQFALAFLSGEKEEDYTWTLQAFEELRLQEGIPSSRCFVTDRELALLNSLNALFPQIDHILCRWHVNMNVVAKTKKH